MMAKADAAALAQGSLRLAFPDEDSAATAAAALQPDNGDHLRVRKAASLLTLEAEAASAMGLLRTLDDALACLRATGIP